MIGLKYPTVLVWFRGVGRGKTAQLSTCGQEGRKVVVSCLKSGATPEAARKIAKIVEARILEKLTAWILELLRKENEEWYRNWIVFDRAVKRRETEKEIGQQTGSGRK